MRSSKTNMFAGTFAVSASRIVRAFMLLTAVALLSSCQQTSTTVIDNNLTGTYTLVSVDGSAVPTVITHGGTAMRVESGRLDINPDRTCSSTILFGPVSSAELMTREVNATYTLQGTTMHMQWQGAGRTTGTVENDIFTMSNEGMVFVYEKQP